MPKWYLRPRAWFWIISAAAVLVVLVLAWFLQHEGLDRADKWSSVVFGSVSALAVAAGALTWLWRSGHTDAGDQRELSLSRLADSQRALWTAEQAARRVRDPWPLDVRWVSSSRAQAVMATWASVRRSPGADPVDVEGGYEHIATVLERDDVPRRLVVLGEPGAGKSMLAVHLTLQVLARRRPDGPVAVLLTAAGWNPVQPLDEWIADQLVGLDHRLARMVPGPDAVRRSLAADLVASGAILPVLDGLDELDEQLQRAALIGISAAAVAGREFVVTCRTRPYEAAVRVCGPIPAAVVVEIQPVPGIEAAQHLADGAAMNDPRWSPIVTHLNREDTTPLAQALSTPLMIWLTRMVYQDPARDPAELLTAEWSTSRKGIEEHLLDYLIPAAYATARSPIAADNVRRCLSLLAGHMRDRRTYDFAWWHLNEVRPAPVAQLISVAFAILTGLATAVLAFVSVAIEPPENGSWESLSMGALLGVVGAFGRLLFTDRHRPRELTASGVRATLLTVGLPLFVIAALTGHPGFGLGLGLSAGVVIALAAGSTDAPLAASPLVLLRADRTAALVSAGVVGLVTAGPLLIAPDGIGLQALGVGLATAVAAILLSAWGQLQLAQIVITVFHRTPLGLNRTLYEACDRGILRRAGGIYQFRHGLLRDRLAARPLDVTPRRQ